MSGNYTPRQQDIIWIDFDPSKGKEIQKRRPAIIISNDNYNKLTGFIAVCPITHGQRKGLLIEVKSSKVDGWINPLQLHTFDFSYGNTKFIDVLDDASFSQVKQLLSFIILL